MRSKNALVSDRRILHIFDCWLKKNAARFRHPPVYQKESKSPRQILRFSGVTKELEIWLQWHDLSVACIVNGEVFDFLLSIDINPMKIPREKFQCKHCVDYYESAEYNEKSPKPKVFSSLEDLYVDHFFEPLLKWSNKYLRKKNILLLISNGGRSAEIRPAHTILGIKEAETVRATPIIPCPSNYSSYLGLVKNLMLMESNERQRRQYAR